jgi:hypothetical protein
VRRESPAAYLKVCAMLVAREMLDVLVPEVVPQGRLSWPSLASLNPQAALNSATLAMLFRMRSDPVPCCGF